MIRKRPMCGWHKEFGEARTMPQQIDDLKHVNSQLVAKLKRSSEYGVQPDDTQQEPTESERPSGKRKGSKKKRK